jgi:hypothetical protein
VTRLPCSAVTYIYLVLGEVEFVLQVCDAVQQTLNVILQTAHFLLLGVNLPRLFLFVMLQSPGSQRGHLDSNTTELLEKT